jgi:mono/diheme cytochrome c family protein
MRIKTGRIDTRIVLGFIVAAGVLAWAVSAQTPEEAAQVPEEIPKIAREMRNPMAGSPESIASGKQIYASQCVMCHGSGGDGKGDLATRLKYQIPDFTSPEVQRARADGEWFYILTHGHGKMTGEGERLSEKVRWDLVNYVRSLGAPQAGP